MRPSGNRYRTAILPLTTLACGGVFAQSPPVFEATSLKPSNPQSTSGTRVVGGPGTSDTSRISWTNFSLKGILARAYGVWGYQISGPPADLDQRYDIAATIPPGTSEEAFHLMVQNLLSERFHLVLHHETKEFQGYELVIDEDGSKLKESPPEDIAFDQKASGQKFSKDVSGVLQMAHPGYIELRQPGSNGRATTTLLICRAQTLSRLLVVLNMNLDRPYVDKTGLTGIYDYRLEFAPENFAAPPDAPRGAVPDEPVADLFAALPKQLGLRLDPKKLPIDVLVIDQVDKVPTGN